MGAQKGNVRGSAKETVVGTYKLTKEVLDDGVTKETREEKTITLRRGTPEPAAAPDQTAMPKS